MPIPKIVHQTSKHLTANEFRLARRLQTVMPEWEYRLWTDADNHMLVQQHFPQYFPMFSSIKRGVVKADIARYMYMAVHGGFYCDTDYKMFRPLDEQLLEHKCILPLSRNSEECFRIGNAVFASSPEHPFWFDFLAHLFNGREIKSCVENLAEDRIEKVTGPEGLTEFYLRIVSTIRIYGWLLPPISIHRLGARDCVSLERHKPMAHTFAGAHGGQNRPLRVP